MVSIGEAFSHVWNGFITTFKSTVLDIELFMQNTFNPMHGYHPKGEGKVGMVKDLFKKLKEDKKDEK
jgi:hypothetical protein